MSRILVEYEKDDQTFASMKSGLNSLWGNSGCQYGVKIRYVRTKDITNDDLKWCDILLLFRPFSPTTVRIAKAAKKMERICFAYYDDDLQRLDNGFILKSRHKSVKKCLQFSDSVISPNPILAEDYSKMTPSGRYAVVNTYISEAWITEPKHNQNNKIRIVYAAGKDHDMLFNEHIRPILPQLFKEFGNNISLTFIGVHPDLKGYDEAANVEYLPLFPLEQYRSHMMQQGYDIGLAPLKNEPFLNRKYFNKFFEYTLAGTFGVYSNCLPYQLIIENGENGLLVDNTPERWLEAIKYAVRNSEMRKRCVKKAQDQLRTRFSMEAVQNEWICSLPEIISYAADHNKKCTLMFIKIEYLLFSCFEMLYKTICYLKKIGCVKLLMKIKENLSDRKKFAVK